MAKPEIHPESFRAVVRALLDKEGAPTVEDFAYDVSRAARAAGHERAGTSVSSIQKHLSGGLQSSPSVPLMKLSADRLKISPTVFAEYRLALAREALDETVAGYDEALERLKRVTTPQPARGGARGTQQRPGSSTHRPASSSASRKSQGE